MVWGRMVVLTMAASALSFGLAKAAGPSSPESSEVCIDNAFGTAASYHLMVLGDADLRFSDTEGTIAVAGSANLLAYSVAEKTPPSLGFYYLVAGNLNFENGGVSNGPTAYAGNLNDLNVAFCRDGTANLLRPCDPICVDGVCGAAPLNFNVIGADMIARSDRWASYTSPLTGTVSTGGTLTLSYTDETTAGEPSFHPIIFDIPANATNGIFSMVLRIANVHRFRTVLLNFHGAAVNLRNFGVDCYTGSGTQNCATVDQSVIDRRKIIWNFPETTSLDIEGVGLVGAILAPRAALRFTGGQIKGRIVVNSWFSNGQVTGQVNVPYDSTETITTEQQWESFLFDGQLPNCGD